MGNPLRPGFLDAFATRECCECNRPAVRCAMVIGRLGVLVCAECASWERLSRAEIIRMARGARRWKALAKRLWRNPYPNRGGMGRHGCAAIDVRMRRHGK